jgi:hypothetical protein
LDLLDYGNRLRVAGPAVEQVEAISAALERDLSQHSAIGGFMIRNLAGTLTAIILLVVLFVSGTFCILERQWRFLGIPIFSLLGLVLLLALPFKDLLAGFAMYQGDPSFIVRHEPQIACGGVIVTILLSFLIPMWQEARRKRSTTKEEA